MKDRTKPPVLTRAMALALRHLDMYIDGIENNGKKIEVISLTRFQSIHVRADMKRCGSPQNNHCRRITYPLGQPMYRGYMLRLYQPPQIRNRSRLAYERESDRTRRTVLRQV